MGAQSGFDGGKPLWDNLQKVRLERDGTLRAPVTADGKDGIRIGDPPLHEVPKKASDERRSGLLARLKRAFGRS